MAAVSIILVSYNSAAHLASCLGALRGLRNAGQHEVLVVDNASRDDSCAIVGAFPEVRLVPQPENLGFAGGVNRGVAAASGECIAVINPDAIPAPDWLEQLIAPLADPAVGVVGSKILGGDGRLQSLGSTLALPAVLSAHRGEGDIDGGDDGELSDVWAVHGAAMAFRRAVWQQLGGFDESFFPAYWEESDFCERVRRAGLRVVIAPRAIVRHGQEASTTGKYSPEFYGYYHRNRLRYATKWLAWDDLWDGFRLAEHRRLAGAPLLDRRVARLVYECGVPAEALDDTERAAVLELGAGLRAGALPDDGMAQVQRFCDDAAANSIHREVSFSSHWPLVARVRTAWNNVATRWYVRPNFEQQTRYNLALSRALTAYLERSVALSAADALETALLAWRLRDTMTR